MAFSGLRSNEQRDLALGRVFLKMGEKVGRGSTAEFLECFGEFTRDANGAVWANLHEGREGFFQTVWRFKKNSGFVASRGFSEFASTASTFDREKSPEKKPVAGKA